ncbi:alanine racemase [Alteromonadaceae bacterium Bs31]|nr:alanine racemase [Alteromonadaceae bacterium Bs31]
MSRSSSDLVINLASVAKNWRTLKSRLAAKCDCGAVVKADAYGLGMGRVLRPLVQAGCRTFYVAYLEEAIEAAERLRSLEVEFQLQPHACRLLVLAGCEPGDELDFAREKLEPVLVSEEMLQRWLAALEAAGFRPGSQPAALKVDTGMGRLGLEPEQFAQLVQNPKQLSDAGINLLMSHLACADEIEHELNNTQLKRFERSLVQIKRTLPELKGSLSNSAGICLGAEYHFDAVRPGIALYGGKPSLDYDALAPVVELNLPVIQVRDFPEGGCSVGYGASHRFERPARVAIIAAGYADGLLRSLSGKGECWFPSAKGEQGWFAPLVGRVSMDSVIVDITHIPAGAVRVGQCAQIIGDKISLDSLAQAAGTISYEILTSLGNRYRRSYVNTA